MVAVFLLSSCGGGGGKVSIIPVTENFSEGETFNLKLDILWVVDPSRSMFEESERVRANISTFMEDIINSGYEYRVGVISSAAWSDLAYQADPAKSFLLDASSEPVFNRFHKGECIDYAASSSNEDYLSYLNTLNLGSFLTNFNRNFDIYGAAIGTSGCGLVGPPFGNYDSVPNNIFADPQFNSSQRNQVWDYANDERPLQSMQTFLSSSDGASFIRPDAFLAVILITDEPDGSRDDLEPSLTFDQSSGLGHTASAYTNYLDSLKGDTANYNVYSIIKTDGSNSLNELVALNSGGSVTDIDGSSDDYRTGLESIRNAILEDSSVYPLATQPVPSSIQISFLKSNGETVSVPLNTGSGGFSYIPGSNSIQFSPPYIPDAGDSVNISFDPTSLGGGGAASQPRIKLDKNEVLENAANGTQVGFVSVVNSDSATVTYSLISDSSGGAFALDSSTGELTMINNSLLDSESQALHSINVEAVSADIGTIDKDITILIKDVIDSVPVAANDVFTVSETTVDSFGNITVTGNASFNDTQIDISETHTWAPTNTPAEGVLTLNNDGSFTYVVSQAALALGSGSVHVENLTYTITDSTQTSNTATITITIEGANSSPVNYASIPDKVVNITGGIQSIVLDDTSFVSSGLASGTAELATDASGATSLTTSSPGTSAHFLQYEFDDNKLFEVTSVELDGVTSMGNTVLQVISDADQVLTREVNDITASSSVVANFSSAVIGKKIKLIRPGGAVNSSGDDDLQLSEIRAFGFEAVKTEVNLLDHFSDADAGDTLTFYVTDKFGEGPAPAWVQVVGNTLVAIPPAGANADIGVLAEDGIGSTAFDVFNIARTGGSTVNSAPIALLSIDDTQRGGVSLNRIGGYGTSEPNTSSIQWDEADEFLDQAIDANGGLIYPGFSPATFDGESHHAPGEDGWNPAITSSIDKFAQDGKLIPLINSQREYGETYTGYFAPAKTGIYRFRSTSVDDVVRLLMSPSEYVSDVQRVITGGISTNSIRNILIDSLVYSDPVGLTITTTSSPTEAEFFPNSWGGGHDTSRFFDGGILGYQAGYVYLTEGNAYAMQVRFMEGGGAIAFNFEFDYKPSDIGAWEGWRPVDAAALVPKDGSDAYTERAIPALGGVDFDARELFYDAELDILDYTAKLVLPDGSDFVGPGSTSGLIEIGLNMSTTTGLISGSLNAAYTSSGIKPRIQITATERFTAGNQSATSLPIKLDPLTAP